MTNVKPTVATILWWLFTYSGQVDGMENENTTYSYLLDFVLTLVLKKRLIVSGKWPIVFMSDKKRELKNGIFRCH